MSTTRYEREDLRGIGVVWALAAALLAGACGGGSSAADTSSLKLPTPVAHASSYAATVATQPAGLACSVSNASGLMPARNVTSVKVQCLEKTHTIGATNSDVNATGVLLFLGLARSARSSHF